MRGILVTGFDRFGDLARNVSAEVVQALPAVWQRSERLSVDVLPTVYAAAAPRLLRRIDDLDPFAVVLLGVARGRAEIQLERVALNLDDCDTPDNAGEVRRGQPIAPDGPLGYWSTLPLRALHARLARAGVPAVVSNHAGTFLCNHVFFAARAAIERRGLATQCGFIHLPEVPDTRHRGVDDLTAAILACLDEIAESRDGR